MLQTARLPVARLFQKFPSTGKSHITKYINQCKNVQLTIIKGMLMHEIFASSVPEYSEQY